VQALPQEPLGRDLREEILRQVEKIKPTSRMAAASSTAADDAPFLPGDTMPQITIFRTRRSWIWASLAVAAGLMIMVLQSGDERRANLPAIARHDDGKLADESRDRSLQPLHRALNEPAPARATDPAQIATAPAAPMAESPAKSETAMFDKLAPEGRAAANSNSPAAGTLTIESNGQLTDLPSDEAIRSGTIAAAGRPSPPPGNLAGERSMSGTTPPAPAPDDRSIELGVNDGSKVATGFGGQAAPKKLAAAPPAGPGGGGGGARGATLGGRLELNDEQNPLVVVHVVAKQSALKSKAFDRLLGSNRIELEPESQNEERAGGAADDFTKQAEAGRAAGRLEMKLSGGERDVELVLVEAPRPVIESCLKDLNKDSENYPGVEVDETPVGQDRADAKAILDKDKKVLTDLSRYSRGIVPQQQKESFSNRYYAYSDADKDRSKLDFDPRSGLRVTDGGQPLQEVELLQRQKKSLDKLGRARRLPSSEIENRPAGKPESGGGAGGPQRVEDLVETRRAQTKLKTPADAEAANLRVLFVFSPERETPSSAPAEKPPK
jgi:hypothetical protein